MRGGGVISQTAEALRCGDLVAVGRGIFQVQAIASVHHASIRLTFQSWGTITVRRNTKLRVVGHEPLQPRSRRPGRPPT
jgi:hypothetical protein